MAKSKKAKKTQAAKPSAILPNRYPPVLTLYPSDAPAARRNKLINRFSEPLILLRAIGQVRGERTPVEQFFGSEQCVRRRFLRNLCYVCDYMKCGDGTTAMALEERPGMYTSWVAANVDISLKAVPFVEGILRDLGKLLGQVSNETGITPDNFEKRCVEFAWCRIKKELRLLKVATEQSSRILKSTGSQKDLELAAWLHNLSSSEDYGAICQLAYGSRKSDQMRDLEERSGRPSQRSQGSTRYFFAELRHYIGRLAHHIRAPRQLIEDSRQLQRIFDNFEVKPVPLAKLEFYQQALNSLDTRFKIFERIQNQYDDPNFMPKVRAEIHVLEHFHGQSLKFASNDRNVACSKPACYCCHLYFRNHPERPSEPGTHRKIWLNWSPPRSAYDSDEPEGIRQRDILNKMLEVIRADALRDIENQEQNMGWHADSHTGITESVDIGDHQMDDDISRDGLSSDEEALNNEIPTNESGLLSTSLASSIDQIEIIDESEVDSDDDGGVSLRDYISSMSLG